MSTGDAQPVETIEHSHGELGWRTPAERFGGIPFLDRSFEHFPSLAAVAPPLTELLAE